MGAFWGNLAALGGTVGRGTLGLGYKGCQEPFTEVLRVVTHALHVIRAGLEVLCRLFPWKCTTEGTRTSFRLLVHV